MVDALRPSQSWLTFTGCVLATAVLYWAQAVIVPVAFATLMAFLLTPVVTSLQHWMGRVPAVLAVVALAFAALGLVGWLVMQQLGSLVEQLPTYQRNIHQKIIDIRGVGADGSLAKLQHSVEQLQAEIGAPSEVRPPLVVDPELANRLWGLPTAIGPLIRTLATVGLVIVLVIFMLLEREALRNRLIRLFGHRRLVMTTRALDEAGSRVSRYLLVQSFVNVLFGTCVGIGLYLIGVPAVSLLWGALAGALRYIPYVGPTVGAVAPLLLALALEGWAKPVLVLALFLTLELFTNLVLEVVVYAGVAGISQVALLVAVAFWAWLWGPLGILLATPLTVCLVVIGKYVPGLEFVSTLFSDEPVFSPDVSYYQRLLAGDQAEAIEIAERHAGEESPESTYDAIMLPALNYAERDRIEGRLSADEERAVIEATRELLAEVPVRAPASDAGEGAMTAAIRVLGVPADGEGDVVALNMLADLLRGTPISLELQPGNLLASEIVAAVEREPYRAVCIADLPPSPPSKSRNIAKRLRAIAPDLPILVGRWAPPPLADESDQPLRDAGATHVAAKLTESRDYLTGLFPEPAESAVAKPRMKFFRFGGDRSS